MPFGWARDVGANEDISISGILVGYNPRRLSVDDIMFMYKLWNRPIATGDR